jgi:hypothetical protein
MKYFIDTEFLEGTQKEKFPISLFRKETKPTIDLISIGIVSEEGREYYAISKDFNLKEAWNRFDWKQKKVNDGIAEAYKDYWVRENVLRNLFNNDKYNHYKEINSFKEFKNLINHFGKTNKQIAKEIKEFVYQDHFNRVSFNDKLEKVHKVLSYKNETEIAFYAYYADYDWVVFCWLFGKMIDLPKGFPMYCVDLKQELDNSSLIKNDLNNLDRIYEKVINTVNFNSKIDKNQKHNALTDAKWNKALYEFLNNLS